MRATRRPLLALLLLFALGLPAPEAQAKGSRRHTVTIRGMAFAPAELTVQAGDTVEWVNEDLVPHTATAQDKAFDSGVIAPQARWRSVAKKRGQHPYLCTLHPTMKGTLIVK